MFTKIYTCILLICFILIGYLSYSNNQLRVEVSSLETSIKEDKQQQAEANQKALIKLQEVEAKYKKQLEDLQKDYEDQYAKILNDHNDTVTSLDRLHETTSQIRSEVSLPTTSKETLVHYVDRYETVFKECTEELTELGLDVETTQLKNKELILFIDNIYNMFDEYALHNQEVDQLVGTTP